MIYLASPYTDPDPKVQEGRFTAVCKVTAHYMKKGFMIFSPIAHCHPVASFGLPGHWEYWQQYDEEMISICDQLWVLQLPGWKESKGIEAEILLAHRYDLKIKMIDPERIDHGNH